MSKHLQELEAEAIYIMREVVAYLLEKESMIND